MDDAVFEAATCYHCSASLSADQASCPSCGASQSAEDRAVAEERRRWQEYTHLWRMAVLGTAILMFGLGIVVGRWLDAPSVDLDPGGDVSPQVSWDQVNATYVEQIDQSLDGLHLRSWTHGPECDFVQAGGGQEPGLRLPEDPTCGIVLEMEPPSQEDPVRLWEALSAEDREAVMGLLSVSYTRALVAGGLDINPGRRGHPRLEIRYRHLDDPLAIRDTGGTIHVYASPFDDVFDFDGP